MILLDTSVWVDHLRAGDDDVVAVLEAGLAASHPAVSGELALGNLRNRAEVLGLLAALPSATVADPAEVMRLIEAEALHGLGIGYVDAHLVASARMTADGRLWTRDRRLRDVARRLGIAASLP